MVTDAELEFAARTDTGRIRPHNEDAIALSDAIGLAIIADGMGGYNAGEVASRIATAVTRESLEESLLHPQTTRTGRGKRLQQQLVEAIEHANASIYEAARADERYTGMGTTLVAALFHSGRLSIAHVGDSRAYRMRRGVLQQLTRDHSLLQEQIDAGLISPDQAQYADNKNLVTRAMGVEQKVEVEVHDHTVEAGDMFLLCSDGLSDMLSTEEIRNLLTTAEPDLNRLCEGLIRLANENGGRDNISVALIRNQIVKPESNGVIGRLMDWIR